MAKAALTTERLKARMRVMREPVVDTTHDFTAMTSAQVLAAYPLASFGSDRYVPQADGSYVLRAAGQAPVTNKGIVVDGAFTNYSVNGLLAGAVAGSPGTMPTGWTIYAGTRNAVNVGQFNGLPMLEVTATANTIYIYENNQSFAAVTGDVSVFSCFSAVENWEGTAKLLIQDNWGSGTYGPSIPIDGNMHYSSVSRTASQDLAARNARLALKLSSTTGDVATFRIAGKQCTKGLSLQPNVLALSSAATTAHTADIIQRAVDLRGPFAVEIVATTAPGDPGAHQTYWCESLGANDYAEIYRATSTNQITLKVRANSTDYSVACGAVANSTQFTLRLGMLFNKVLWSLNGSTVAELTIKRSAPYIMETLGALWDATLYGWCSIQSIRVSAGKIATAAEIEGGWA